MLELECAIGFVDLVFAVLKGVARIRHDGTENYYRCLVLLSAEKLVGFEEGRSDKQYRKLLDPDGVQLSNTTHHQHM